MKKLDCNSTISISFHSLAASAELVSLVSLPAAEEHDGVDGFEKHKDDEFEGDE